MKRRTFIQATSITPAALMLPNITQAQAYNNISELQLAIDDHELGDKVLCPLSEYGQLEWKLTEIPDGFHNPERCWQSVEVQEAEFMHIRRVYSITKEPILSIRFRCFESNAI